MGPIACLFFIVLALIGMSSSNPVIGKKSKQLNIVLPNKYFDRNPAFQSCESFFQSFLPQIPDSGGEFDMVNICLRNCAQCKKMYGSYFEGQLCADGCIKFKGKVIPGASKIQHFKSGYEIVIASQFFHIQLPIKTCSNINVIFDYFFSSADCEDIGSIAPFLNKF